MNYYNEIKNELINNEAYKRVKDYSKNRYELERYYNVGKLLVEAQGGAGRAKYGNKLIAEYSEKLTKELGKGYSERTLKYMRKFYLLEKRQALPAQLSWTHFQVYMNYIDKRLKKVYQDKTIGIIITKRDNHFIIEYSSDDRILTTEYKLI